ncbi:MAG: MarR family transcriptional regulator [Anaerolinea sp.]|nr:MarR family transcriptional regulator [Anaerolinea sp.]
MHPNDHPEDLIPVVYELRLLLGVMMRSSVRALEERLAARGAPISALQYLLMTTLHYHPLTLSDLSRKVQLDPSTISTAIDALVRKGYLTRGRDLRDRRRIPLSLTETGNGLLRAIPDLLRDDLLVDVMTRLGADRATALRDLLREAVLLLPDGSTILRELQQFVAIHVRSHPALSDQPTDDAVSTRSDSIATTDAHLNKRKKTRAGSDR